MSAPVLRATLVLMAGLAGGYVFVLLHLPLPWTLGAMTAAGILATFHPALVLPPVFRDGARPVIGVVAGSAFAPEVVAQMGDWWPIFVLLVLFFLGVTGVGILFFRRLGFDRQTALFAAMPGGMGEMAMLGMQFGADIRKLVLVHAVRQITVVTVVPFAIGHLLARHGGAMPAGHVQPPAGADWAVLLGCVVAGMAIGRRLRGFGGLMLVPLTLSALAHGTGLTTAQIPYWIVALMQVMIGSITGARFAGLRMADARGTLLAGLVWVVILLALSAVLALVMGRIMAQSPAALFLALAPGGFSEMIVIAYASGVEVAFVVTCHAFRTIYIMLVSPLLSRLNGAK